MMSPFEECEFLCMDKLDGSMTVRQVSEKRTILEFKIDKSSVHLDWFQVRDMYTNFNEWLVNNAHLAKEN